MTKRSAGRKARKAEMADRRAQRRAQRANRPLVAIRGRETTAGTITDDQFQEFDDLGAEGGGPVSQTYREAERLNLDTLTITELRKMSRGKVKGGYSMKKPDLIGALLDAGVTA